MEAAAAAWKKYDGGVRPDFERMEQQVEDAERRITRILIVPEEKRTIYQTQELLDSKDHNNIINQRMKDRISNIAGDASKTRGQNRIECDFRNIWYDGCGAAAIEAEPTKK